MYLQARREPVRRKSTMIDQAQTSQGTHSRAVRRPRRAAAADNLWAPPPPTICGRRRRRLLLIGAPPPPPIICRRAADTVVVAYLFLGIFDDFFFKFSALWQVHTSDGFMFLDVELLLLVCCIPRSSSSPI